MMDTSQEFDRQYDRFLREFEAFLRARSKKRRPRLQPLLWLERFLNWTAKAIVQATDSFVTALVR